jgi:hypothetical protein
MHRQNSEDSRVSSARPGAASRQQQSSSSEYHQSGAQPNKQLETELFNDMIEPLSDKPHPTGNLLHNSLVEPKTANHYDSGEDED